MVNDCLWEFAETDGSVENQVIVEVPEYDRVIVLGYTARTSSDSELTIKIGDRTLDKLCLGRHDNPTVMYGLGAPKGLNGEDVTFSATRGVNFTVYYEIV